MLSDTEQAILEIESQRWKYAGAKEAVVRERLRISYTRYCQVLDAMIDRPEVEAVAPALVHRLRRLREARRRQRSAQR